MFHKAKFFEYEKEFRIALSFSQSMIQFGYGSSRLIGEYGTLEEMESIRNEMRAEGDDFLNNNAFVPVDLSGLIEEVVVGPNLGSWYHDLVEKLVRPAVSQDVLIRTSSIGRWQHV